MRPEGERQVRGDARKNQAGAGGALCPAACALPQCGAVRGAEGLWHVPGGSGAKAAGGNGGAGARPAGFYASGRAAPAVPGRCGGGGGPPFLFPWRRGFYCAVPCAVERCVRGRFCGGWQHHHPAACQKSVFHTGEGAHAQGGRGVHGMGHREAVYQGRDLGAVCEFHLFRQRIL